VVILKRALKPLVVTRLRRDPLGLFTDLKREQGDHARVRFGRDTLSLISHPDDIQHMLVSGDRDFPRLNVTVKRWRRRARRRTSGVTLGPGADPTLRLAFRRALQPTYSRARIDSLWPELVRAAEEGVERWPDAGTIGVVREVEPLGMDLVVRAVFGQQLDLPLSELVARIHACVDLRVYASSAAYRVTDRLRLRRILRAAEAYELLEALLRRHLAQRRSEPARGDDVLSRLLGVDEAKGLGDEQLVLEALAQLFVGGEQVANVASWALQLLSQHPAERDRLRREAADGLDDPKRLSRTSAVVGEALRLHPPVTLIGRQAGVDMELGGRLVHAGDPVLACPYLVQRDERWWPNPDVFEPERWLDGSAAQRPRLAFVPFGAGPRQCAGEHLGWRATEAIVATVVSRFDVVPAGAPPSPTSLRPAGLELRLERNL